MHQTIKAAILTNMAPLYVAPVWEKFARPFYNIKYTFVSSANGHDGIKTIDVADFLAKNAGADWRFVKNVYIGRALIYQRGLISEILKNEFDVYVFSGEMYNISTWIAALFCRIKKKPVFFWGHGYYGNEKFVKKAIRLLFYKIADYHFLYGERARHLLIGFGFDAKKIFTVYNSLDYENHEQLYNTANKTILAAKKKEIFPNRQDIPVILFIGRLTKSKKIFLLLEAVKLQTVMGNEFNVLLVGDGEDRQNLASIAAKEGLGEQVHFYGACYDDSENGNLIMLADCCVSPGNVGLTAIHCLALGLPVITHNNFANQGPEAETVVDGKTGFLFEENNIESLSSCIGHFAQKGQKQLMEQDCIAMIRSKFNPESQFNIISSAINALYSERNKHGQK